MKTLVIDASVAIKWFIPEEGSIAAVGLLDGKRELIAPDLIRPEVANIIWKLCSRGLLKMEEASQIIEDFLSLPVDIHDNEPLIRGAFEIAAQTKRTVYDSLYLALAIQAHGVMVTADEKFANALKKTDFAKFITLLR